LSVEKLITTYPVVLDFLVVIIKATQEVVNIVCGSITSIEQSRDALERFCSVWEYIESFPTEVV
jgi:hypothetical protein